MPKMRGISSETDFSSRATAVQRRGVLRHRLQGEMMISSKVIADSISTDGKRLTTMQVTFHRFILPEFNTHRVFSRNFSSSRAIPTSKLIEQVRTNPAMPIHFGQNQPGMQAKEELTWRDLETAKGLWILAAVNAASTAEHMADLYLHKQVVNRALEPFLYVTGIVTATEFDNFFELRCHKDAQPEIQELASRMLEARSESKPTELGEGEWHLPYVKSEDFTAIVDYLRGGKDGWKAWTDDMKWDVAKKVSAARCCRVSYLTQEGREPSVEQDLILCERLAGARPIHASPFEHQATPLASSEDWCANFRGWHQHRKDVEAQVA